MSLALNVIYEAPAQMILSERLLLYSLVYGLRPTVGLEIGTAQGGAAMIISAAMDAAGCGKLICIDPAPQISRDHLMQSAHRAFLIEGTSPEAIVRAYEHVGSPFDFILVDGDHSYSGVLRDIEGSLQFLHYKSYLLFHDAHYVEVEEAIEEALKRYPLVDCGMVSVESNPTNDFYRDKPIVWGGLRLLRFSSLSRDLDNQELASSLPATRAQTEIDTGVSRMSEQLEALSGWQGALVRNTFKFAYHALPRFGRRVFRHERVLVKK